MTDLAFHFTRIPAVGEMLWHVRQGGPAGRFLGTVVEVGGGYQATRIMAGGALPMEWFLDRQAAARWLARLTQSPDSRPDARATRRWQDGVHASEIVPALPGRRGGATGSGGGAGETGRVVGFRFRGSVRNLPGLRVNLSKSGASLSVGRRGATVNFGKRDVRTTVGLPGTGLSYSKTTPGHAGDGHQGGLPPAELRPRRGVEPVVWIVGLAIAMGAVAFLR